MPAAVAAPRPASVTPRNTPVKAAHARPRSAIPPSTAQPKVMRAASPPALSSSSSASSVGLSSEREWELDRVRRLLYEQECVELKGQLEEKHVEIETIRQEKTRLTKSFWEGRARAMALLQTLTRKREERRGAARSKKDGSKQAAGVSLSSSAAPVDPTASTSVGDVHPPAAAVAPSGGEDSDLQTLQDLTKIILDLGNVSSSSSSSVSAGDGGGGDRSSPLGTGSEKQPGEDGGEGSVPVPASTAPEKEEKATTTTTTELPAAVNPAPAGAAVVEGMEEGAVVDVKAVAAVEEEPPRIETMAATTAAVPEEGGEQEFDLDLFKLRRQAAKLRDELAKRRFAEMALDVRLKETEDEAARLAEQLRGEEGVVAQLRLEVEEKDARLMEFVSRVHDIEVRLGKVARERDDRTAEAAAAVEAVRFYQSREELASVSDSAANSRRASLEAEEEEEEGLRSSSVVIKEEEEGMMKGAGPEGSVSEEESEEEDAEVAGAVAGASAEGQKPSPPVDDDGSLGSVLDDDQEGQLEALRALHTPWERILDQGLAFLDKHHDAIVAPRTLAAVIVALFVLLALLLLRGSNTTSTPPRPFVRFGGVAVEDPWTGARRSPLVRLQPGGAPLLAGEYMASCRPGVEEEEEGTGDGCYFLWNQWDGNLVLYRGLGPAKHRGPVWASNTLVVPPLSSSSSQERGGKWGSANVTAWLAEDRTLQLVDAPSGKVMWRLGAWRLPRELTPWPFGRA